MKKIINKKMLIYLSLVLLLLLFVGCNNATPPVNHVPTITSIPTTTATVGASYTYNVDATDPDGDTLIYTLTVNPLGMTINSSTGVIGWTPTSNQIGDYNVTVKVTDGEFTDTQTFVITVQLTAGVLTSIAVLPETMTLSKGNTQSIASITASYDNATTDIIPLDNPACVYSSDNPGVATVTNGIITAVDNGWATITVSYTEGSDTETDTIEVMVLLIVVMVGPVHNITQSIDYMTIQAALNAAKNGDTIEVANGVYNESITFPSGKMIILRSVNGAPYTFINGVNGSNTVTCNNSLGGTNLEGFTISHKSGTSGAGVSNNNGTLTITGCAISGNSAPQPGGGVRNYHSTLNITGCNISGNSTVTFGGGIFNDNGALTIIGNSVISKNDADNGGGICNYYGISTVTGGSTISENSADNDGGGIMNNHGTLTVTGGSTISENITNNYGGGITNRHGTLTVAGGATVSENIATHISGGGIDNYNGTVTVNGATVSENFAGWWGGGIYNDDGTLTVTGGSIISENSASDDGGGVYNVGGTLTIGGSSGADTANFNNFINNKLGNAISSAQHIRGNDSGDIHGNYPYNYYNPN